MKDLQLIAGKFLKYFDFPKEKEYLLKYFEKEIQKKFLAYYLTVGGYENGELLNFYNNFTDHTGIYCSDRYILTLLGRIKQLEKATEKVQKDQDIESIFKIKMGKIKKGILINQKNIKIY